MITKTGVAAIVLLAAGSAFAQQQVQVQTATGAAAGCQDFQKNPDGSWTPLSQITITGPNGTIRMGSGVAFRSGVAFGGVDLAANLDRQCP